MADVDGVGGVLDEFDRPNLTLDDLWEWLYYDNDIPVSRRQLRDEVLYGDLVPTKLGNKNYFSRRQGLDWVAAQLGKKRGDKKRARAAESGATPS